MYGRLTDSRRTAYSKVRGPEDRTSSHYQIEAEPAMRPAALGRRRKSRCASKAHDVATSERPQFKWRRRHVDCSAGKTAEYHRVARKQRKRHILFDAYFFSITGDMNVHKHKSWVVTRQVVPKIFRRVVRHNVGAGPCFNLLKHFSDIGARQHQSRLCDERIQRLVEGQHLAARMYFRHLSGLAWQWQSRILPVQRRASLGRLRHYSCVRTCDVPT